MAKEIERTYYFKDEDEFKNALNAAPQEAWIETRKLGGNKTSQYIPIAIQEALGDVFFSDFDIIDEHYQFFNNEILCTVKISYTPNYPEAMPSIMTGSASKPIQTSKGSRAEFFPKGKIANSGEYNVPAVRTAAKSNALTSKANVFGRNLGRAVSAGFNFADNKKESDE